MAFDIFKLDGRVALITGGTQGLGLAMAQALAEAGADVVVTSRDLEKAQRYAGVLASSTGRRVLGLEVDITKSEQIDTMVEEVIAFLGRIDILVNNAGINIRKPAEEFDEASWDLVQQTNLKAPFLCARAVVPHMKKQGTGRIINLASMLFTILEEFCPDVTMSLEMGALEARHIRVLADDYWPAYPPRSALQLAQTLRFVSAHTRQSGDWQTPFERNESVEAIVAYEEQQLAESLAYVKQLTHAQ